MIKAKIIRKGNTFGTIAKNIKKIDGEDVKIGYFSEQGPHHSGMSYPQLMALLEHGYEPNNLPKRPIFQITAFKARVDKDPKVKSAVTSWAKSLTRGDRSKDLLDTIGKFYQGELLSLFGDTSSIAPNSLSTIKIKGRDDPLVHSGDLKRHLAYKNSINKEIKI